MIKKELVAAIAEKTGAKKVDVDGFINAFVETVVDAVAGGDTVRLTGFGTFGAAKVAARSGKASFGGQESKAWTSPEHNKPVFKAGKTFKAAVR